MNEQNNEDLQKINEGGELEEIQELSDEELEKIGGGKTKTSTATKTNSRTKTTTGTRTASYTTSSRKNQKCGI